MLTVARSARPDVQPDLPPTARRDRGAALSALARGVPGRLCAYHVSHAAPRGCHGRRRREDRHYLIAGSRCARRSPGARRSLDHRRARRVRGRYSSNLFAVQGGKLLTRRRPPHFAGITRARFSRIAATGARRRIPRSAALVSSSSGGSVHLFDGARDATRGLHRRITRSPAAIRVP